MTLNALTPQRALVEAAGLEPASGQLNDITWQQALKTILDNGGGGSTSIELVKTAQIVCEEEYSNSHIFTDQPIWCDTSIWNTDKILWVHVRNHAGKQTNKFFFSESFFINVSSANGNNNGSTTDRVSSVVIGLQGNTFVSTSSAYGIALSTVYPSGKLEMKGRYSSSYGSIVGTFDVSVFLITPPDGIILFE